MSDMDCVKFWSTSASGAQKSLRHIVSLCNLGHCRRQSQSPLQLSVSVCLLTNITMPVMVVLTEHCPAVFSLMHGCSLAEPIRIWYAFGFCRVPHFLPAWYSCWCGLSCSVTAWYPVFTAALVTESVAWTYSGTTIQRIIHEEHLLSQGIQANKAMKSATVKSLGFYPVSIIITFCVIDGNMMMLMKWGGPLYICDQ